MNEKGYQLQSMPVHNGLYNIGAACFRANITKGEITVERPDVIAAIIPEPLVYEGNTLFIVMLDVKELKEGFSDEDSLWKEIAFQIPVVYRGETCLYIAEVHSDGIRGIIGTREIFGYPKVPARIYLEKNGKNIISGIEKFGSGKKVIEFSFALAERTGTAKSGSPGPPADKKMPKIIALKYIPSAALHSEPDVKQLIAMKYGKPIVYNHMTGEGLVKVFEHAPEYFRQAGFREQPVPVSCVDIDTTMIGGEVLHNYKA